MKFKIFNGLSFQMVHQMEDRRLSYIYGSIAPSNIGMVIAIITWFNSDAMQWCASAVILPIYTIIIDFQNEKLIFTVSAGNCDFHKITWNNYENIPMIKKLFT